MRRNPFFDFSELRPNRTPFVATEGVSDTAADREFEFTDRDFNRIRELIIQFAGISLSTSKQNMVYSRLSKRLRATGHVRFCDYLDGLNGRHSAEWEQFVNALTTNLTSFYREAHHFPELADYLLSLKDRPRIELWCCASSTGEEPYTMAITAMEAFKSMTPPVRILATDIDTRVLAIARAGIYKTEQVEKIPPDILKRYFIKGTGTNEGVFKVKPELQALMNFRPLNLLDRSWPIRSGFDAIFCRNVLIYFDKDVQLKILQRFSGLLTGSALLFAGHSENFSMAHALFKLKSKTIYEKI
ncbi:MAG: CheR family methyltransferase [Burkholderiaceae bacterium]|jgi:chemotaxis protein methyltransferase CheR